VFEDTRKTRMSLASFQRRIASSVPRFAAKSSPRRSGVAFARRVVRAGLPKSVLRQA
jgi:hypothetical protein